MIDSSLSRRHILTFTNAAARKVKGLIDEENNPHLNLRVFITGGGCSGFQYGFTFDETINQDDLVVEKYLQADDADNNNNDVNINNNKADNKEDKEDREDEDCSSNQIRLVRLLVDPLSLQYLEGAEIDYCEDVSGAQFVIRNPNAKTTCGCGSSFAA